MKGIASIRNFITYLTILILSVGVSVFLIYEHLYPFLIVSCSLIVTSIIKMILIYLDSMRKVSFMFNAIECDDYSFQFSDGHTKSVNSIMLNASLNRIKEIMTNAKQRAIEREKYYELIINSVRTGILIVDTNGNIYQTNKEALRLFGTNILTHTNQLRHIEPSLTETINSIKPGEHAKASFNNERGEVQLAMSASKIDYDNKTLRVISINDINSALDQKEVESWIKLTRVLTHEIMNSLAPITSLSDTLIEINEDKTGDIAKGLDTISTTGKSLISFVKSYRKFTRIQTPVRSPFAIKPLLERVSRLICEDDIAMSITSSEDDILIYADEDLVTQVIINILRNAVQELSKVTNKKIDIDLYIAKDENVVINISNNGGAIPNDIVDDIFMPFFTNKNEGSGIGLSIAKQIMHLHGGSIRVTSNINDKVTFTLTF
ncbi:MAG: ATP-binding protein [Rikenellaceae bacterium]